MRLTIVIDTDNAAFGENEDRMASETSRILRALSEAVLYEGSAIDGRYLMDINGNKVGQITITRR